MAHAAIMGLLGRLLSVLALIMLIPAATAFTFEEFDSFRAFLAGAALTLFVGLLLIFAVKGSESSLRHKDAILLGVLAWTVPVPFAAMPLWSGIEGLAFGDAAFEVVSGLTTTGLSLFPDPGLLDHSVLLWRAILQWLGGLMTLAFAFVVLPALGSGGIQVHRMDSPSRIANTVRPRLRQGARAIWSVYAVLTVLCAIALWFAGMPGFDAVCAALSTLSTGGFATRTGGVEAYGAPMVEIVLMLFMLIGAVNFYVHWRAVRQGPRIYFNDPEVVFLILLVVVAIGLALSADAASDRPDVPGEARRIAFAMISALTTSGFETGITNLLPGVIVFMILALAIVGGATGSTAGGLKLMRIVLLLRQGAREMILLARPHGVVLVKYGGASVPLSVVEAVWGYFGAYLFALILLTVGLAASGLDFSGAITLSIASFTNTGAVLAEIAAIDTLDGSGTGMTKFLLSIGMLVGRLEILTLLVMFNPRFWRD